MRDEGDKEGDAKRLERSDRIVELHLKERKIKEEIK